MQSDDVPAMQRWKIDSFSFSIWLCVSPKRRPHRACKTLHNVTDELLVWLLTAAVWQLEQLLMEYLMQESLRTDSSHVLLRRYTCSSPSCSLSAH